MFQELLKENNYLGEVIKLWLLKKKKKKGILKVNQSESLKAGDDKLWPTDQIQSAACFCKQSFTGIQPWLSVYLSTAASAL